MIDIRQSFIKEFSSFCDAVISLLEGGFKQGLWEDCVGFSIDGVKETIKLTKSVKSRLHATKKTGMNVNDIADLKDAVKHIKEVLDSSYKCEIWDNGPWFSVTEALSIRDQARLYNDLAYQQLRNVHVVS